MNKKIYFITGPTAIGKSKFALDLCKEINGEIINADSMQIYKELKVLTARPSNYDNKKVQHHLYGYINGNERYNVEKWCHDAVKIINTLNNKNIVPVFVGGTGLYVETLIKGITPIPTIPEKIKEASNKLLNDLGINNFYELVYKLDPESVKKISKNDSQRLKRVWEVDNYTNKKFSSWQKKENKKFLNSTDFKIIIFLPDRKKNYGRVDDRVLKMIKNGAIEEVKNLINLKYEKTLPIMKAHGVPEITSFLKKSISLEECIKKIQLVTRHYVKRQNTWWKSSKLPILEKFDQFPDEIDINLTNLTHF